MNLSPTPGVSVSVSLRPLLRRSRGDTRSVEQLGFALLGALVPTVLFLLRVVPADADRHDRQIAARDEDLEEWILVRDRELRQRLHELGQQVSVAGGKPGSAVWKASQAAARTIALYDYRDEARKARAFVRDLEVEERWFHRFWRSLRQQPLRALEVPERAEPVLADWQEDTGGNALSWKLDDLVSELQENASP